MTKTFQTAAVGVAGAIAWLSASSAAIASSVDFSGGNVFAGYGYQNLGGPLVVEGEAKAVSIGSTEFDNLDGNGTLGFSLHVDFDASSITIDRFSISDSFQTDPMLPFNGLVFRDSNGSIPWFASVAIDPSTNIVTDVGGAPLTLAQLGFDNDEIRLNLAGYAFDTTSTRIKLNVTFGEGDSPSPVPAPVAAPAVIALVGLLALARRRPRPSIA